MQQHCEQFVGKQKRLVGQCLDISDVQTQKKIDCTSQFSPVGYRRTQFRLIYGLKTSRIFLGRSNLNVFNNINATTLYHLQQPYIILTCSIFLFFLKYDTYNVHV